MSSKFCGEFNKAAKFYGWLDNEKYQYISPHEELDEQVYAKIVKEIINTLGDKPTYDIFDVAYYFKKKYQAFRIPCKYFWYYKDTLNDQLNAFDNEPIMESLNASYDVTERNITLVIDTVFNDALRESYPAIKKSDERNKLRMTNEKHYSCRHENPIFILGTKDGKKLNSIYLLCGDYEIEDLNHEFYYFFEHS